MTRLTSLCILTLAASAVAVPPDPATAQELPTLSPADYGGWEQLGAVTLDPSGRWLAASVTRVDESREIRLHRVSDPGDALVLADGSGPVFSADGRFMAYRVGAPREGSPDSDGERPRDRLGVVDLSSGADTVFMEVTRFAFSGDGAWLAALGVATADSVGADLTVMRPWGDTRTTFGNVDDWTWPDEGHLLAATIRTASGQGNGVVAFDPDAGRLRSLDTSPVRYRGLTWRDDAPDLGVLREVTEDDRQVPSHDILLWRGLTTAATPPPTATLSALGRDDLPDSLRVTEYDGLRWNASGDVVFVGLRPWGHEAAPMPTDSTVGQDPPDGEDVGPSDVQIWHWNDDRIVRMQEEQASRDRRRTYLAAWHLDGDRLVRLGWDLMEPARPVGDGDWALEMDGDPYHVARRFGAPDANAWIIDVDSGQRTMLVEDALAGVETGPRGIRALVHEEDRWFAVRLQTGERTPLGDAPDPRFTRSLEAYDYPGPRPPWGVAAWMADESAALLYDQHDVWRADLETGDLTRLTRGAESGSIYRIVDPDPASGPFSVAPNGLDPDEPVWLSLHDPRTKADGYAVLEPDGRVRELLRRDARVTGLTRAEDADRYVLRMERFDDSPDAFVASAGLQDLRQITETNPLQADFAWGHSELVDYTTDAGHALQAILIYPAGYDPSRRYPMILYQYERLSDNLHRYVVPSQRSYYNAQVWSQEGYFVLMPDIVYEPGRPGPSALDAVEHAMDAALAAAPIDPDRVGLVGHSWGGYQAAYLPTRTDRFAAVVAGAPITNFLSFMGAVHWNGGFPETGHWETGQARMAVPYWDDMEGHLESSPANFITDLHTPVMVMQGTADGVVDFRQGLEYYNYARRAGKRVLMLVYPGADHGLRKEENQVDYHRRILQWFGHYLKDEPPPEWIARGQTWLEHEEALGRNR